MFGDRVVETIERHLETGVVGVALAIIVGDEVRAGGFGRLDIDRADVVTPQTRFPIQSVTKTIVASALMQWVERGAIGLDDPVNRHLAPIVLANEWEAQCPVTIRQLLTHTAGLPSSLGLGSGTNLEELVALDVKTEAEPGTRLIYANWGYDVAGYLVARLAGLPWEAAVDASVLRPLGMRATAVASEPAALDPEIASGHVVSQYDGACLRVDSVWQFAPGPPSGALVSNLDDLARFLVAHLDGGGAILGSGTVADMQRVHAPLGPGGGGMGLGFRVDRRRGRVFFCHGGDGGGCTTFIGGHPEERVGVVLLINTAGAQAARSEIARAALDSVLRDELPVVQAAIATSAAARPTAGRYVSTYWGVPAEVTERDGGLAVTVSANAVAFADSTGTLTEVDGRWRADGGMFAGCELDFEGTGGDRRFYGGLYAYEFFADEAPVPALPTDVDEHGDPSGSWTGDLDTPIGMIPIGLTVNAPDGTVAVDVMGTGAVDAEAHIAGGWIRARFDLDVVGFGAITLMTQLGVTGEGLRGLLYARNASLEIPMAASLDRNS